MNDDVREQVNNSPFNKPMDKEMVNGEYDRANNDDLKSEILMEIGRAHV